MTASGLLELEVPALPVALEHDLNGRSESSSAVPDTLCVLPSRNLMFVVARWVMPFEQRQASNRTVQVVPATHAAASMGVQP
jgi:hypothetical protein